MKQFFLLFLMTLLVRCTTTTTVAQKTPANYLTKKTIKGKAKKYYDKGMEYNLKGENQKALKEFSKALKSAPNFIDGHIQIAAVNYDMKNYGPAETSFEKVLSIDPNYQKKVAYVLGLTEMKLKKYDEAAAHLEQYLNSGAKNKSLIKKAKQNLSIAKFTAQATNAPVPFKPESLGDLLNTENAEYLPSLTADGETLVYTRRVRRQEDFYISKKVDGKWQKGIPMEDINTDLNEGAQSISADGKLLVFTICNQKGGYGNCDLYFSEVVKGRWTKVANMGASINSKDRETQPSLSADGRALYFSSNRPGGFGGMDVWVSYRDENGKWAKPQNLGEQINTDKYDRSPFIHADGQTLYFMSDGHPGMGGHDLFFARLQKDGTWGTPQNMGYPINTKADESTMIISLDGTTAYFATDRNKIANSKTEYKEKVDGIVNLDLFSFPLYPEARPQQVTYVKGKIFDVSTKKNLEAKVEFIDLSTGKLHAFSKTDESGTFLICLPLGKDYALNVSKEKYLFHSENFALANKADLEKPYTLEIGMQPVPIVVDEPKAEAPVTTYQPIILRNVFFDTGSAELRSESFIELNLLKNLLEENQKLKIRINGHTDNVGTETDNLLLSENRAKAVHNYLVDQGIDQGRLSYKGFGESLPIETNESLEGRQSNRRTEFVVVEK